MTISKEKNLILLNLVIIQKVWDISKKISLRVEISDNIITILRHVYNVAQRMIYSSAISKRNVEWETRKLAAERHRAIEMGKVINKAFRKLINFFDTHIFKRNKHKSNKLKKYYEKSTKKVVVVNSSRKHVITLNIELI